MQLEGLLPTEQLASSLADLTRGSSRRPHIHMYSLCSDVCRFTTHPQVQFVLCVVMPGSFRTFTGTVCVVCGDVRVFRNPQVQFCACVVMPGSFRTFTGTVCAPCDDVWGFRTCTGTVCTLCNGPVGFPHSQSYSLCSVWWCLWVFRTSTCTVCAQWGDVCRFSAHAQVQFVPCVVMAVGFPHTNRYSLCPVWWCHNFPHMHRYSLYSFWWSVDFPHSQRYSLCSVWWCLWVFRTFTGTVCAQWGDV